MTSLLSGLKQIPQSGYYIPVNDCRPTVFVNNGTDAAPSFGSMISSISTAGAATSTLIASAGAGVFRDMGKTLISSGRTFRKVQLLINTPDVATGLVTATSGVGGAAAAYLTGYIILPGSGGGADQYGAGFTPVARLG
jgi:hypothetical protein